MFNLGERNTPQRSGYRTEEPKCPRCGSRDFHFYKITIVDKIAAGVPVDLSIDRVSKTCKCKACSHKWVGK